MYMYNVNELIEKTILLVGQANTTRLYERMLNFLGKNMSSAKKAKMALKENESEFKTKVARTKNYVGLSSTM
jgi:hypothetical protein